MMMMMPRLDGCATLVLVWLALCCQAFVVACCWPFLISLQSYFCYAQLQQQYEGQQQQRQLTKQKLKC